MSENCFLREKATENILKNVASFCSECYSSLAENQTIFYDMKHYRYLCSSCQENIQEETKGELVDSSSEKSGLFN